jgi:hypothetical protein
MIGEARFDFCSSLSAAVATQESNPSLTLLVSIEPDSLEFNRFWSDPIVLSTLSPSFLAVRLDPSSNSDETQSFLEKHNLTFTSSLVCFESGALSPSNSWVSKYPTPSEFHCQFRHLSFNISDFLRITAIAGTRSKTHVFKTSDTILVLKLWIDHEFGSDWQITVLHTNRPLPEDDSLSVADLAPSAILQLRSPEISPDWSSLPSVRQEERAEADRKKEASAGRIEFRASSWEPKWPTPVDLLAFFNPWPEATEIEDFFVTK